MLKKTFNNLKDISFHRDQEYIDYLLLKLESFIKTYFTNALLNKFYYTNYGLLPNSLLQNRYFPTMQDFVPPCTCTPNHYVKCQIIFVSFYIIVEACQITDYTNSCNRNWKNYMILLINLHVFL